MRPKQRSFDAGIFDARHDELEFDFSSPQWVAFGLELHPERERVRIAVTGELDLSTAPKLREAVAELLGVGFEWLALDLRDVTFMDCAGLGVLLDASSRAAVSGARFDVLNMRRQPVRLLALVAVDQPRWLAAAAPVSTRRVPADTDVADPLRSERQSRTVRPRRSPPRRDARAGTGRRS